MDQSRKKPMFQNKLGQSSSQNSNFPQPTGNGSQIFENSLQNSKKINNPQPQEMSFPSFGSLNNTKMNIELGSSIGMNHNINDSVSMIAKKLRQNNLQNELMLKSKSSRHMYEQMQEIEKSISQMDISSKRLSDPNNMMENSVLTNMQDQIGMISSKKPTHSRSRTSQFTSHIYKQPMYTSQSKPQFPEMKNSVNNYNSNNNTQNNIENSNNNSFIPSKQSQFAGVGTGGVGLGTEQKKKSHKRNTSDVFQYIDLVEAQDDDVQLAQRNVRGEEQPSKKSIGNSSAFPNFASKGASSLNQNLNQSYNQPAVDSLNGTMMEMTQQPGKNHQLDNLEISAIQKKKFNNKGSYHSSMNASLQKQMFSSKIMQQSLSKQQQLLQQQNLNFESPMFDKNNNNQSQISMEYNSNLGHSFQKSNNNMNMSFSNNKHNKSHTKHCRQVSANSLFKYQQNGGSFLQDDKMGNSIPLNVNNNNNLNQSKQNNSIIESNNVSIMGHSNNNQFQFPQQPTIFSQLQENQQQQQFIDNIPQLEDNNICFKTLPTNDEIRYKKIQMFNQDLLPENQEEEYCTCDCQGDEESCCMDEYHQESNQQDCQRYQDDYNEQQQLQESFKFTNQPAHQITEIPQFDNFNQLQTQDFAMENNTQPQNNNQMNQSNNKPNSTDDTNSQTKQETQMSSSMQINDFYYIQSTPSNNGTNNNTSNSNSNTAYFNNTNNPEEQIPNGKLAPIKEEHKDDQNNNNLNNSPHFQQKIEEDQSQQYNINNPSDDNEQQQSQNTTYKQFLKDKKKAAAANKPPINTAHVPTNFMNALLPFIIKKLQGQKCEKDNQLPATQCDCDCGLCTSYEKVKSIKSSKKNKNLRLFREIWGAHKLIRLYTEEYIIHFAAFDMLNKKQYKNANDVHRLATVKCLQKFLQGVRNHENFVKLL